MSTGGERKRETVTIVVLMACMLLMLSFLATALYRVQVLRASEYASNLDRQSIRRVRLPGIRGRIFDRYGVCLADNRPSYCVAIYIEELRRPGRWSRTIDLVDAEVDRLAGILELERQVSRADIKAHVMRRLPLPFLAWQNIDQQALARLAETGGPMPGVDIYVRPEREYPHGALAAHIIGYVGRDRPVSADEEPFDYYLPELRGRAGMEQTFDSELGGIAGGELIRVDAIGFKHEARTGRKPLAGNDLRLTLDSRLQAVAHEVLNGRRGAAIVLDPRNGDVLAIASSPTYNLAEFTPFVPSKVWNRLISDTDHPLLDRAVAGRYPPGSIFKPIVAIAALQNGVIEPDQVYSCPGYLEVGKVRFHCWNRMGHGEVALRKAIEQSCNAYFCELGLASGHSRIYHMARAVGLGYKTGIPVGHEVAGLVPNAEWKRKHVDEGWYPGDTCNLSIGQGSLLVTPIQMAVYAATLANGGTVFRPRLIHQPGAPGEPVNRLNWDHSTLAAVVGGMHDVVEARTGTGKRARLPGVEMAGKTGTAEYVRRGVRRKHTWMIAFAPYVNPRYAAVVLVEDGDSGGLTAAPRIRRLMETAFELERGAATGPGQEHAQSRPRIAPAPPGDAEVSPS